jgi:DNA-binding NarL/FixJ family response regulator
VPIRIVVADDDADVLDAVCDSLTADGRFDVVATARDAGQAVDACAAQRPDAVLLDVRMPGSGIRAAAEIHRLELPVTIMAASAVASARDVADLLHAGARGIFAKGQLGADLGDLIARCCAGQVLLHVTAAAEGLRGYARRDV